MVMMMELMLVINHGGADDGDDINHGGADGDDDGTDIGD